MHIVVEKYFLNHKSLKDKLADLYDNPSYIQSKRTQRSWTATRHKRVAAINKWAKSLAGRRFYRKLHMSNNLRHLGEDCQQSFDEDN